MLKINVNEDIIKSQIQLRMYQNNERLWVVDEKFYGVELNAPDKTGILENKFIDLIVKIVNNFEKLNEKSLSFIKSLVGGDFQLVFIECLAELDRHDAEVLFHYVSEVDGYLNVEVGITAYDNCYALLKFY